MYYTWSGKLIWTEKFNNDCNTPFQIKLKNAYMKIMKLSFEKDEYY